MSAGKRTLRIVLLAILFLPGIGLLSAGAIIAYWSRASIENAVVVPGRVERLYKRVQHDTNGTIERDWVSVSFTTADGKAATRESEVFSTRFLSVGDPVSVRYDAADPARAKIAAGFFAEPYSVVFLVLFGAFWLAIPTALSVVVWSGRGQKQELLEKGRASQREAQERRELDAREDEQGWKR